MLTYTKLRDGTVLRLYVVLGTTTELVVLLMGMGSTLDQYKKIADHISGPATVVCIEYRGIGQSEGVFFVDDPDAHTSDILDIIVDLPVTISSVVLVGVSFGTSIARELYNRHVLPVTRMVLTCPVHGTLSDAIAPVTGTYDLWNSVSVLTMAILNNLRCSLPFKQVQGQWNQIDNDVSVLVCMASGDDQTFPSRSVHELVTAGTVDLYVHLYPGFHGQETFLFDVDVWNQIKQFMYPAWYTNSKNSDRLVRVRMQTVAAVHARGQIDVSPTMRCLRTVPSIVGHTINDSSI